MRARLSAQALPSTSGLHSMPALPSLCVDNRDSLKAVVPSEHHEPTEPQEAALEEHLRSVAYRNGRGATLFIALFALVLYPTDWLIFPTLGVLNVIVTLRATVIVTLFTVTFLMRTSLGP